MRGNPRVIVKPVRVIHPLNGEIWVDGYKYKVTIHHGSNIGDSNCHYDFDRHPFRDLCEAFLLEDVDDVTARTVGSRCQFFQVLFEFVDSFNVRDLNPAIILKFIGWLKAVKNPQGKSRFTEWGIAAHIGCLARLYDAGLGLARPGWSQRDFDLILKAVNKERRGIRERSNRQSIENAMSSETFFDLTKAMALEREECMQVLQERKAGKRVSLFNLSLSQAKIIDPNPFVVFSLEAGLRYGLRSQELNALRCEDVRIDPDKGHHCLYVHAPDKADDFIPIEADFLETFNLCLEWSKEAREIAGDAGKGLYEDGLLVYLPAKKPATKPLIPLSTHSLNSTHLPYFYKKWFRRTVKDGQGNMRPMLHAEEDETKPLKVNFMKMRNAFAARFIEREPNCAVAQRVMRHRSFETTRQFYTHRTTLDHAKKVQLALGAEAQLLVLNLKNPIETGINDETVRRAKEAGAMTPHGVCGPALAGASCEVASDCLVCPHLVVIASRKPRLEADREEYLRKADMLIADGDHRGAENVLSRAKLCQAHILRIDTLREA